ncbi:hypothetical protein CFOL_v3_34955 [Cephalotus follicularis]|uniref:Poly(A) RNA polymerase mitochondrial-like central palm domain-containing protein n=1 Tax=Cephalotus follicularis TaxID=3775 RepID=A0A1Q3DGJ7_CEPFO|nr:hypothetical protein CFOL_v3_34955 [Cephalotus follicularis]
MALLHQSVLLKKAKNGEFEDLAKHKISPASVSCLDKLLIDVCSVRHPKPADYGNRTDLVRVFNAMAKELHGNSDDSPVVEAFGSFVMDMFSADSDLDLSINFSSNTTEVTREMKIKTLRKFAKKLNSLQRGRYVTGIQTIVSAKVPIVKVIDCGTRIECDLSVQNKDGIAKSQIIHMISAIDERFQKLSSLMKAWAKANSINSSKDRTLNSFSIILLVAFHLQTRDPPILPPFSVLFKGGTDPATVSKMVNNYLNYGASNKESLGELLVSLFVKLASVKTLWNRGLCASLYEGSWTFKTWNSHINLLSVEDFIDRSQNVSRAVDKKGFKKIYNCIHSSLDHLFTFLDTLADEPLLKAHMFGKNFLRTVGHKDTTNPEKKIDNVPVHHDSRHTKKMRLTEGSRGTQFTESWVSTHVAKGQGGARYTEGWGQARWATALAEVWGGTQLDGVWGRKQELNSWGGKQPMDGWGGEQQKYGEILSNSSTHLPLQLQLPYQTPQVEGVWGKMQKSNGWGGKIPMDGWGGTRQSYSEILNNPSIHLCPQVPILTPQVAYSFNNAMCNGPSQLPSVPTAKPVDSEGSSIPVLQQSLVYSQKSLGHDVSYNVNPIAPMPYLGPIYSLRQSRSRASR